VPFAHLLDNEFLRMNHDPACHNFYTLERTLKRVYPAIQGSPGFDRSEDVTIVFFRVERLFEKNDEEPPSGDG